MSLGKSLTVGDTVHFFSPRYSFSPVAAVVTAIVPSGESRRASLTVFPQDGAPFTVSQIEHRLLLDPGRESDYWDWRAPSSAVAL